VLPSRAYAVTPGWTSRRASASSSRRASALVAPGSPSRSPTGTPASVQPRSGLASAHGITIVNTPGLVDSGYRGELRVALLNTDAREAFVVEPGMRIAQLVIVPLPGVELVEVDELPSSERGVRGFGSSLR
jgi:dUTP pyrophosphatase